MEILRKWIPDRVGNDIRGQTPDGVRHDTGDAVRIKWFICLFLVVAILGVYGQVFRHEFILFDDPAYITENAHVRTGLSGDNLRWAFTATHAHNWHPLTWISHMLDVQLFGLKAGYHILVNVFFHIANTVLLFLILHRMTRALWQSAFVAALFALHPLHVESVAWAAERKDVLSTFFWMLTLGAYALYVERPGTKRYLLVLSLFALGLMAKPMLVTLPFVLLLLDYWPLNRFQPETSGTSPPVEQPQPRDAKKQKRKSRKAAAAEMATTQETSRPGHPWSHLFPLIREKIPFFALSLLSSIITVYAQQEIVKPLEVYSFSARMANALVSYAGYIGKMLWPSHLAVFYPHPGVLPAWQAAGAAAGLAVATSFVIRYGRRFAYLPVGWFWYLGTLVPVIGLVQVGLQAMADRYTYVPLVGLFIIVAWGISDVLQNFVRRRKVWVALGGLAVLISSVIAYAQVSYWKNDLGLFQHAIQVTTNNYWAHYNLGLGLAQRGDFDGALHHFRETLRIKPDAPDPYNNIGIILAKRGDLTGAVNHFSEALRLDPGNQGSRANLRIARSRMGGEGSAIPDSGRNLQKVSPDFEAYYRQGVAEAKKGNLDKALFCFSETLRIKPDHAQAHNDMGVTLARKGRLDEAISHFREVLRIQPNHPDASYNLKTALDQKNKSR